MIKIEKFPFAPKGDPRLEKWGYLDEAMRMQKYIKDGDVIFDCGANIFDHTVFFAINNPNSKIVAFEPIKEYFEMGLKNVDHFNVNNVIPMNVALGEKRSEMNISVCNEGSSMVFDHEGSKLETIHVETIDRLVENKSIPAPNVIKIDVEGFALPLIKGAIKTLKKYKPIVIIEIHPMFVGEKEAMEKIHQLQSIGLNVIEQLAMGREFVMSSSKGTIDFDAAFNLYKVRELRNRYDASKSKIERREIISIYKEIAKNQSIPLYLKVIWSRLYVFFTFKWIK